MGSEGNAIGCREKAYLESAAQTENAVIRLLWRETLDGGEDDFGLLWDQVIGSVFQSVHNPPLLI